MTLRMARPMRRKGTTFIYYRERIPSDVLGKARGAMLAVPVGRETISKRISDGAVEVALSLRTRDPSEAKQRHTTVQSYLQTVWQSLRDGPKSLSHQNIVSLAGEVYHSMAVPLADEPGSPEMWADFIEICEAALKGALGRGRLFIGVPPERRIRASLEDWMGPTVDTILAERSLVIDHATRTRLLTEAAKAAIDAGKKLKRNAAGDYSPDPVAERFPARTGAIIAPKGTLTFTSLLEGWWREKKAANLAESTREGYGRTLRQFAAFLKHDDPSRVTADDVIAYKEYRLTQINPRTGKTISAKTIRDADLAALSAVFGWAAENRKIAMNPAKGISIDLGKPVVTRSKGFTNEEALTILGAAFAYRATPLELPETAAAKRWVPWLCAYTGARVGEMLQLRKLDVRKDRDIWVISITPEAGGTKTKKRRDVPLHPHLVEQGFPEFTSQAPDGYLFARVQKGSDKPGRRGGPSNRLREWIRDFVPDKGVAPNHGWRHRFITLGREYGMDQEIRRMITGHKGEGIDEDNYGDPAGLYREICKLPRYEVD